VRVPDDNKIAYVLAFVNLQKCLLQQAGPGQISRRFRIGSVLLGLLAVGQEGPGLQRDKISTC
jgi:hypothetical protein